MRFLRLAVIMVVLYLALPLLFLGIGSRAISFIIPTAGCMRFAAA